MLNILEELLIAPLVNNPGMLTLIDTDLKPIIAIILGAIPGALSRYYITVRFAQWLGTDFPFGTFVVNLSGVMLMGFFSHLFLEKIINAPNLELLLTTGFLGSYTTFSTYTLDISFLLRDGRKTQAILYGIGSMVLGAICLKIGIFFADILGQII